MKLTRNNICIICLLVIIITVSTEPKREHFTKGAPLDYQTIPPPVNENYHSWIYKANNYAEEMKYQDNLNKSSQQTLKSNKKSAFILSENDFKPECCPANYTSSNGCACITLEQEQELMKRGGNHKT